MAATPTRGQDDTAALTGAADLFDPHQNLHEARMRLLQMLTAGFGTFLPCRAHQPMSEVGWIVLQNSLLRCEHAIIESK
jgi:hypothetical protein